MSVLGIDVSKWQGQMDWAKAKSSGAKFAFIRAGSIDNITQELYTDTQYGANALFAKDNMVGLGAYWYFRPQFKVIEQADYFVTLLKQHTFNMPPVADVEYNDALSPSAMAASLDMFLNRIISQYGKYPIIYTRATFFNPFVEAQEDWNIYDLWIARYTTQPEPWGNPGDSAAVTPRDWDDWTFWQWSADGNGRGAEFGAQSASIDLDYFNGDEAAFNLYVQANEPLPTRVSVIAANGTVVRSMPGAGLMLRVEPYNACLGVVTWAEDDNDQVWYLVGDGYVKASNVRPV